MQPLVSISIVSHGQGALVAQALADLRRLTVPVEVLLTLNLPERIAAGEAAGDVPLHRIENTVPKGFGANHNAAFRKSSAPHFCVMNPDVRVARDPFPIMLDRLRDGTIGVMGPRVMDARGSTEDSARPFPTPSSLLMKALGVAHVSPVAPERMSYPDWIAGMFMLYPRSVFEEIGGFDEGYYLYYEDVDICARLRRHGYRVAYCTEASVVHEARRESRQNLRYMRWHLSSMMRFLAKRAFRKV